MDEPTGRDGGGSDRGVVGFWTVPNALCVARFGGSFALLPIAVAGLSGWFVGTYLVLILTDLIDGPIARSLRQRSAVGAHLDSIADLTLNACLLVGVAVLCWDQLRHELPFVGAAVASYGLSAAFGIWKFRHLPSYHTYIAKATQWLAMIAAVCLVMDWSAWPLRVACLAATLGNLEATAITATLTKRQSDVPTLFRVWPRR